MGVSTEEPPQQRGRRTRARILDAATTLFAGQGYAAVSVAAIARAAAAHPNQITYYFGSKDGLFVHAAFAGLLRDASRLEPAGLRQRTPESYRAAMARTALALPSIPAAVQAMSVTRLRTELQPAARMYLAVLFRRTEHQLGVVLARRGWTLDRPAAAEARTFWSAVLGARLIGDSGYGGHAGDVDIAGLLTVRSA